MTLIDHYGAVGGAERVLHGLVCGFMEIPEARNWDFVIMHPRRQCFSGEIVNWPEQLRRPGIDVGVLQNSLLYRVRRRVATYLRRVGAVRSGDVVAGEDDRGLARAISARVHLEGADVAYFLFPFHGLPPRLSIPIVTTLLDLHFTLQSGSLPEKMRAQWERSAAAWLEAANLVIVSSNTIAAEMARCYPDFVHKIRVVRFGIPRLSLPSVRSESEPVRAGLPERFIVTVGGLVPHKNHQLLLQALARLRDRGRILPLVCVGAFTDQLGAPDRASPYTQELLALAKDLGLVHGRDFVGLGYVTDEQLDALYRQATALVMPTFYEAGSFPIREAVLGGCPVVCSKIPALEEELALIGGGGLMFDPQDPEDLARCLDTLLDEPVQTRRRAEAAQRLVAEVFDWRATARGYLRVFEEAIGAASNAPEYASTTGVL